MGVEFGLFGDVQARIDGRPVDLGHARQRCVLVVLLVEVNQVVSVEQLVDRVWADRAPLRARDTLYGYVYRLRRVLSAASEIALVRRSGGYCLSADPMAVDVHRFGELVGHARATDDEQRSLALFDEALGLWQGEPFSDLDTPWLNALRDDLDRQRLGAEMDRTDLALRRGRHSEVLAVLPARVAAHPLDERLAGQYMLALYRGGRQAEALQHYRQIRLLLAEELGADPSPPLEQLHQQILTTGPVLATPRGCAATSAPPAAGAPVVVHRPRQAPQQVPSAPARSADRAREISALTEPSVQLDGGHPRTRDGRRRHPKRGTGAVLLVCFLLVILTASAPAPSSSLAGVSHGIDHPSIPCPATLQVGEVGTCVEEVQSWLVRAGLRMPVDGVYGPYTKMRVSVFQLYAGIPGVGIVDERTRHALRADSIRIEVWSPDQVERRLREVFPEDPDRVVALVRCLSSLDPLWVVRQANGARTWGLFQLTDREVVFEHQASYLTALNPEWNIQTARAIRDRSGGLDRWTCTPGN